MGLTRHRFLTTLITLSLWFVGLDAQTVGPSSGDVTVQLVQGLDSATDPKGISQGIVMKSTNKAIPNRSMVVVGLGSDPINGGYTTKLLSITINGQTFRMASSQVGPGINLPSWLTKGSKETYAGTHVFLPTKTWVKFTLTEAPAGAAAEASTESSHHTPAPEPKDWQLLQVDEIESPGHVIKQTAATIHGTVKHQGRITSAILVMHCGFPTTDYPNLLPLEVLLSPGLGAQFPPAASANQVDVSSVAQSQLGSAAKFRLNATGHDWASGTRYRFFYELPDMQDVIAGNGQNLRLSLGGNSDEAPDTEAAFALPADNEPVKQIMASCIQKSQSDAATAQAQVLASCPSRPGLILSTVSVKFAATGKEVQGVSDEMDDGGTWTLPAPVKGRAPRKTVMACSYIKDDVAHPADSVSVPIPDAARSCEFVTHANPSRSTATCVGAAPKQPKGSPAAPPPTAAVQPNISVLVSCPSKPGKSLVNAEVYDEPGRTLIGNEPYENGFGASWIVHVEPGHHDVLTCLYGAPGTRAGSKTGKTTPPIDQISIPIPKEAVYCTIDGPRPVKVQCTKQ